MIVKKATRHVMFFKTFKLGTILNKITNITDGIILGRKTGRIGQTIA